MERIHNLLRKIQDIYYKKEEKQVIDIDLMLDYTRVLYADLLDARTDILAKQGMGLHLKDQPVAVKEEAQSTVIESEALTNVEPEILQELEAEISETETAEAELETPTDEAPMELDEQDAKIEALDHVEEVVNVEEEKIEEVPEQVERVLDLQEEEEVPASKSEVAAFAEEQIEETLPTESNTQIVINDDDFPSLNLEKEEEPAVFSEIHFELPEVKDKASESPKQGFLFQKQKDIRSFIGINDKYQFMNELFANNRTAYEETLDKLSAMESYAAAEDWLLNTVVPQYSWSKDDETFLSLLQTSKKFFAA